MKKPLSAALVLAMAAMFLSACNISGGAGNESARKFEQAVYSSFTEE